MNDYDVPSREIAASLDDRAEWPHRVPQWETADGGARFVILRALSAGQKRDAERAAMVKGRDGAWAVDDYLLMCEEVRRGIAQPADLPLAVVLGWNNTVVLDIYAQLQTIAGFVPARITKALQAIAGPPPPVVARARRADDDPVEPGADGSAAAEDNVGVPADAAG